MRVLVAGASGAVGRSLLPRLITAGHEVVGWSRTPTGTAAIEGLGARSDTVDVLDADAVGRALDAAAPDAVIHQLTALSGGSLADNAALRIHGTRHLVDAAGRAGVRRFVAQSISWAYAPGEDPATEDEPLDIDAGPPRGTTIAGVAALEAAVREMPEPVLLRYGSLHGPGTFYAPGGRTADRFRAGELTADDAVTSFVHVDDAARAAVAALEWPVGAADAVGAINVVDDEPAPAREWMPVLADALGVPRPPTGSGRAGWERGADDARVRALGWRAEHPWRRAFADLGARTV